MCFFVIIEAPYRMKLLKSIFVLSIIIFSSGTSKAQYEKFLDTLFYSNFELQQWTIEIDTTNAADTLDPLSAAGFEIATKEDIGLVDELRNLYGDGKPWISPTNDGMVIGINMLDNTSGQYDNQKPSTFYNNVKSRFYINDSIPYDQNDLLLSFYQTYVPFYFDTTYFIYSYDGINYEQIEINKAIKNNEYASEEINIELKNILEPDSSYFWFGFEVAGENRAPLYQFGGGIAWALDDITLTEIPDINISITEIYNDEIDFGKFVHRQIPFSQRHAHKPHGVIQNLGKKDIYDMRVEITSFDQNGLPVDTLETLPFDLVTDQTYVTKSAVDFIPEDLGVYSFKMEVIFSSDTLIDEILSDNIKTTEYELTNAIWSDQDDPTASYYYSPYRFSGNSGSPYADVTVGQAFYTRNAGFAKAIEVLLPNYQGGQMTDGQQFDAILYKVINRANFFVQDFGLSDLEVVAQKRITAVGDYYGHRFDKTTVILLHDLVPLEANEYYIAALSNQSNEPLNVGITFNNRNRDFSGMIYGYISNSFDPSNLKFQTSGYVNPDIRLWLYEPGFTNVEELDNRVLMAYPNPANDKISISGLKAGDYEYAVYSILGNKVANGETQKGEGSFVLNTSDFESGSYVAHFLNVETGKSSQVMFVAQH